MAGVAVEKPEVLLSEQDLLLTRSEALEVLRSHGKSVARVVRVCDDDAILYLTGALKPWTAWIDRSNEGIVVTYEHGWHPHPHGQGVSVPLGSSS